MKKHEANLAVVFSESQRPFIELLLTVPAQSKLASDMQTIVAGLFNAYNAQRDALIAVRDHLVGQDVLFDPDPRDEDELRRHYHAMDALGKVASVLFRLNGTKEPKERKVAL